MKDKFLDMVKKMDMSFSYKPVILKALVNEADSNGRVAVEDIVEYFIDFYEDRKNKQLLVKKRQVSIAEKTIQKKEVEKNIFSNPFKRFEDMRFMKRSKDLEYVEFNKHIWRKLTVEEKIWIDKWCDEKLEEYYRRIS